MGKGMLEGIRILDFSHVYYGPYATMILADMGAEVLKVEPPWGEINRLGNNLFGGMSSSFHYFNRNKKGLAFNLKDPKALEIVKELAKKSDIIVENFKRGTMDKLGLGYEQIKIIKPDIIYASLSGFGLDGPFRDRPSFAPIAESQSSWLRLSGDNIDPNGPPVVPAEYHGDLDPGLYATIAILGALRHRDRTGEGQLIDVSQLDVMIAQSGVSITSYALSGELPWVTRKKRKDIGAWGIFKTKDGKDIYVAADQDMEDRVLKAMGVDSMDEGGDMFKKWVGGYTAKEAIEALASKAVPCAPVHHIPDMLEDPQVKARETVVEINHKTAGKYRVPQHPVKYSKTPATIRMLAPVLGEHNDEVLRGLLGYSQAKCDELRAAGVIV
jgi:crotonobetainyl-CoA:carnitine CoA-transferase CaiB-like acyl-CoA transferase